MDKDSSIKLFEEKSIRTHWDADKEKWYFSIVDVIAILTDSETPRHYWTVLKGRLKNEGNETVTNCGRLKMISPDGKMRLTDVADTEQLLRLIQSIPSKKAEPFKLRLARVGSERIDETADPEIAIDRVPETYLKKGYSRNWINQRLKTIEVRKELTDEWEKHGITEKRDFAILTDEITRAWSGRTTRQYKELKGLKKESLRDGKQGYRRRNTDAHNLKNHVRRRSRQFFGLRVFVRRFGIGDSRLCPGRGFAGDCKKEERTLVPDFVVMKDAA
jgi:hypothetical protein